MHGIPKSKSRGDAFFQLFQVQYLIRIYIFQTAFDKATKIRQTAEMENTQDITLKQNEVYENISEQTRRRRETPKPNLEEPEVSNIES